MTRTHSLTTPTQFVPLIAHLPLAVLETTARTVVVVPTETGRLDHLFHALEIAAGKRGLTVRRGARVWTVKGCALESLEVTRMSPRYILTRMKADPMVPTRYQQHGWMAFDTTQRAHGQIWPTRAEAVLAVTRLNAAHERRNPDKKEA